MCTADNIDQLLAGQPDFVLDAIDNIHTKVRGPQLQAMRSSALMRQCKTPYAYR
jgi:tRNA A37 threonylcarbamoyladenosine dehydratase